MLQPGETIGLYHWEADQEDFLVIDGEGLLIIEGEERQLRRWDFVHCPARAAHNILAARDRPCVVLAVGARDRSMGPDWGGYLVDETARRHGVGVERATPDPAVAYESWPEPRPVGYREGSLPE